jgi:hypothetical protein
MGEAAFYSFQPCAFQALRHITQLGSPVAALVAFMRVRSVSDAF